MKAQVLLISLAFAFAASVQATILHVPGSYAAIQSAINASSPGDTIAVSPGTYFENLNFRGKNVMVTSLYYLAADTSYILSTVINGSTPVNPDTASCVIFNSGEDSTAVLQGFTITRGSGTKWTDIHGAGIYREGAGILIELSSPTIMHNLITDNAATDLTGVTSSGGGGLRIGDANPSIYSNVISHNQGRYGAGIVLNYSGGKIKNNIIFSNTGGQQYYGGSGIWITHNHSGFIITIENNTITGNYAAYTGGSGGISIWNSTNVFIRNNIIRNNNPSPQILNIVSTIEVTYSDVEGGYAGTGNTDLDPLFATESFFLADASPCIDAGDPATTYYDPEDPVSPGNAMFPSKGLLRNDMGAYGGPLTSLFPSFGTVTGIHEIGAGEMVSIFPNPFSNETTVRLASGFKSATLRMFNGLGQEILVLGNISGQEVKIQRENLPAGVYLFRLTWGNKIIERKVIIAN